MNSFIRPILLIGIFITASAAQADVSVNVGFASEYHYRGIFQKNSSANGGIDWESNGFYAGSWAADVGDGLEVDVYGGYGTSISDIDLSVGFTGYYYTGDFDDTYQEVNLGAGFAGFSFDVALGEYENFDGPTQDYTYYALTYEHNGFYGTYGGFARDFDGEYLELGYGATVYEFDLGVSLIFANDDLVGDAEESIVFTIGKSFDL